MRRKRSIALVIREHDDDGRVTGCGATGRWLVVRRPDDDEDLPGVWGLPAGTSAPHESEEDLVRRIGREKLGVRLEPGARVASGSTERPGYTLEMDLWTARLGSGGVDLGRGPETTTRYSDWKWDGPLALEDGARAGSLCCRLGLELV